MNESYRVRVTYYVGCPLDPEHRDVSSDTEKLLDRLGVGQKWTFEIPAPTWSYDFVMPIAWGFRKESADPVRLPNYARIEWGDTTPGSSTQYSPFPVSYHFLRPEPDEPENTDGSVAMRFTLDAWATLFPASRTTGDGDLFCKVQGHLIRTHDLQGGTEGAGVIGGDLETQPAPRYTTVNKGGTAAVKIAVVYRAKNAGVGEKVQDILIITDESAATLPQLSALLKKVEAGASGAVTNAAAGLFTGQIQDIMGAWVIPADFVLPDGGATTVSKVGGGGSDLVIFRGTSSTEVHTVEVAQSTIQTEDAAHIYGNISAHIVIPRAAQGRRCVTEVTYDPNGPKISMVLRAGYEYLDITDSARVSFSTPGNTAENIQAKIQDTLSLIGSGMTLAGGAATGNVLALASGALSAVSTTGQVLTRQTMRTYSGALPGVYNCLYPSDISGYDFGGIVLSSSVYPVNAWEIEAEYKMLGWRTGRWYNGAIPNVTPYSAWRFAGQPRIISNWTKDPNLIYDVEAMLAEGVRIWDDSITTNYLENWRY